MGIPTLTQSANGNTLLISRTALPVGVKRQLPTSGGIQPLSCLNIHPVGSLKPPAFGSLQYSLEIARILPFCSWLAYFLDYAVKAATRGDTVAHKAGFSFFTVFPSNLSKQHSVYDNPFSVATRSRIRSISVSFKLTESESPS